MGRFYKTGKGDYIDFIYKQPKNLLLQAVKTAEAQIDEQAKLNADLYGKLNSKALTPDKKRRDEILAGYREDIDTVAKDIMDNPLNYRRSSPKINQLTRDISQNLQRGELAAFESNVAAREAYKAKIAKDGSTTAEQARLLKNYDAAFAYDQASGKRGSAYGGPGDYRSYTGQYLDPNVEIFDFIDKRGKGWQSDIIASKGWYLTEGADGNPYVVTKKGGTERVDPKEIEKVFSQVILNDPTITKAWGSRMREGIYTPKQVKDLYTSAINYATSKFGFTKDRTGVSVNESAYGLQISADLIKNPPITSDVNELSSNTNALTGENGAATNKIFKDRIIALNKTGDETKEIMMPGVTDTTFKSLLDKKGLKVRKNKLLASYLGTPIGSQNYNYGDIIDKNGKPLSKEETDKLYAEVRLQANAGKEELNTIIKEFNNSGDSSGLVEYANRYNLPKNSLDAINKIAKLHTPEIAKKTNNYFNYLESTAEAIKQKLKNEDPEKYENMRLKHDWFGGPTQLDIWAEKLAADVVKTKHTIAHDVIATNDIFDQNNLPATLENQQAQKYVLEALDKMKNEPATFMLNENSKALKVHENTITGTAASNFDALAKAGGINWKEVMKYETVDKTEKVWNPNLNDGKGGYEQKVIINPYTGKPEKKKQPYATIDGERYKIEQEDIRWTNGYVNSFKPGHKFLQKFVLSNADNEKVVFTIAQQGSDFDFSAVGKNLSKYMSNPELSAITEATQVVEDAEATVKSFAEIGANSGQSIPQFQNSNVDIKVEDGKLQYYKDGEKIEGSQQEQKDVIIGALIKEYSPQSLSTSNN